MKLWSRYKSYYTLEHPGKLWNPDESGLDELIERAVPYTTNNPRRLG